MFIKYARKGLSRTATVPSKRKHFHKNILAGSRSQKVEELKSVFFGGPSLVFGELNLVFSIFLIDKKLERRKLLSVKLLTLSKKNFDS